MIHAKWLRVHNWFVLACYSQSDCVATIQLAVLLLCAVVLVRDYLWLMWPRVYPSTALCGASAVVIMVCAAVGSRKILELAEVAPESL